MAPRKSSKGRQEHPTGPLETVDDDWKQDVRDEMTKRGWDQKDLAEKISVSEASITNMFKPGKRQIRFKGRIAALFGWADPAQMQDVLRRIQRAASKVSVEEAKNVASILESLAARR